MKNNAIYEAVKSCMFLMIIYVVFYFIGFVITKTIFNIQSKTQKHFSDIVNDLDETFNK